MSDIRILHNPRCSKSRQALALLEEHGASPEIVLYLEDTPDAGELRDILAKLGISARQLLRKGEPAYKELNLANPDLSEAELVDAMIEHPKLIERPIVIRGARAVLGRPPEQVLALLQSP